MAGLTLTFVVTIAVLAEVVDGVGLGEGVTRTIAIVVLLAFGIALAVPAIGDRLEAPLSRLARFGPKSAGDGFWSGMVVGGALGFVYAPCAGPILAAVVSVGGDHGRDGGDAGDRRRLWRRVGGRPARARLGGRSVVDRIRSAGRGPALRRVLGAVMVVTALAMATDLDVRFQTALANDFPACLSNPTRSLERSGAVEDRLADLRGEPKFDSSAEPKAAAKPAAAGGEPLARSRRRARTSSATSAGSTRRATVRSISRGLRGRVVLIDFWTYTCINCIRTLPYVKAWDARYRKAGLTIVGVHTPEFGFEHDAGNVSRAIRQNGIRYPVAQDNDFATWNAWGNQYWPAKYLIDAKGRVRYSHFGEGDYRETERAIRALLAARDRGGLGGFAKAKVDRPDAGLATPETYLGSEKAQGWAEPPVDGVRDYQRIAPSRLPQSAFALGGKWRVTGEAATAVSNSTLSAKVVAGKVFMVLRSRGGRPRRVGVTLDGRRLAPVTVTADKLYTLVSLPRAGEHGLKLDVPAGVSGYAFTFG